MGKNFVQVTSTENIQTFKDRKYCKDEFVSSSQWEREVVLRMIFVYGHHIKEEKQMDQDTWARLLQDAEDKRLRVEDIRLIKWSDMRVSLQWWWRKIHEGSIKTRKKNVARHEKFLVEATTYWRKSLAL